jgi:hypothetical protein
MISACAKTAFRKAERLKAQPFHTPIRIRQHLATPTILNHPHDQDAPQMGMSFDTLRASSSKGLIAAQPER